MLGARPRLGDDRLVTRRAGRERAHDRVAHVPAPRLHPLRHRRLVAVPVAVERLVVDAGRLVEDRQHDDAGGTFAVGPRTRRRVLVVAVVAVDRLGDEVAGAPDAGFGEERPRRARGSRARRARPSTHARTGSSSSGTLTIVGTCASPSSTCISSPRAPAARMRGPRSSTNCFRRSSGSRDGRSQIEVDELLHGSEPTRRAAP